MGLRKIIAPIALALMMFTVPLVNVHASSNIEDDLNVAAPIEDNVVGEDSVSTYDTGVADLFKNHRAMTPDQLEDASRTLTPVTNGIGYIIGGIMVLVCVGIFLITALDLLYIAVPPLRGILYKGAQDEMQGGMMGGYGGGYGGYGGRMGMGMSGGAQRGLRFQLISDEAVQCSALIGGGQQSAGGGMPGGYGGMAMQTPQNEMSNKSVILTYFKKRVIFLIFFAICAVMLTSSIFLGTGINIAQWLTNMVEMINGAIPS